MKKFKLLIISLIFGFGLTLPCHAINLGRIITEVRLCIKDPQSSRQIYSSTQLTNIINEAQEDVVNRTWILSNEGSIELTPGTSEYTLPTDVIAIQRVVLSSTTLPEITLQKLDSDYENGAWFNVSGRPTNYYQKPNRTTKILFFPFPATSASTGTVNIIYYAKPVDLSENTDVPFFGSFRYVPYHDALIYYTAARIFLIEGETDKYKEYKTYYEDRIATISSVANNKVNYLPAFSGQRK